MSNSLKLYAFWTFVGVPLAWGIFVTLQNALKLFT